MNVSMLKINFSDFPIRISRSDICRLMHMDIHTTTTCTERHKHDTSSTSAYQLLLLLLPHKDGESFIFKSRCPHIAHIHLSPICTDKRSIW